MRVKMDRIKRFDKNKKDVKVNFTIPVYNEESVIESSVIKLRDFLMKQKFSYTYEIVIADNASTDATAEISVKLAKRYKEVEYIHIPQKGRGLALRKVWLSSDCDVVSYMDVDLATDLKFIFPLIERIIDEKCVMSIGSRLHMKSKVMKRSLKRECISRCYNLLLRLVFWHTIKDHQCGFKAIRKDVFVDVEPYIENNNWFFDTELILQVLHYDYKISQIPVTWVDDPDTKVKIMKTVMEDLKGVWRMKLFFVKEFFRIR